MSKMFENFGGSLTFAGSFDTSVVGKLPATSLLIQLADKNEWLEDKVRGFCEIVVRYHGKEHRFTPDEVLQALYTAKEDA